jgi:hypothetical protein
MFLLLSLNQEIVITKGVSLINKHDYTKSHARHKHHEREKRKQLKARDTNKKEKEQFVIMLIKINKDLFILIDLFIFFSLKRSLKLGKGQIH